MSTDKSAAARVNFRAEDIAALRRSVEGPVLEPGTEEYVAECATYNLTCGLRPALVVGAAGESDVRAAVRFAVGTGCPSR
ncbi:hypothetical protein STRCI_008501 [Streptomyces cinnabarinus]|uniref:Uncharacterized protein n=1 Tax=Streptomyces cinnabarinus TaxID=67287 RepID=A0ABY7KQK1_9ACTN|nr:hypothetical protein [Streptomyces cinnabarinus]WAZ26848.1 hypothetical protein STRCI_008501 [Streptomyces cinnabarinus]